MRRLSARVRLAVVAMLAAGAALAVLTVAIDRQVRDNLVQDVDGRLQARLDEEIAEGPSPRERRPAAVGGEESFGAPVLVWRTAADGTVLSSDTTQTSLQPPAAVRGTAGVSEVWLGSTHVRVLTGAINGGGTVSVGASLDSVDRTLDHLRSAELLLEPVLLLLVLGGAWLAARRTLAPVERLRRTAEAIGEGDTEQRFRPGPPHDELGRLAATFDTMLDRLALARQRQRQLTADASHELRTPLAVIEGETALALRRQRPAREYRATLERIAAETGRMERSLDDLLWLARVDEEAPDAPRVSVDLAAAARACGERFAAAAAARDLTLAVDGSEGPNPVEARPGWVERLLAILVDNACKYTTAHGHVWIRAAEPGVLEVEDDGPGIPEEDRSRLRLRFERGDEGTARGSGLGLAIADAIVRRGGASWTIGSGAAGGTLVRVEWEAGAGEGA